MADSFGKSGELDVGKLSLPLDLAAVLGREVGGRRCELSYRRCETPTSRYFLTSSESAM